MQKIANAPSDGVILGFAFRRCFRFLSATFLLIRTAIRQMAETLKKNRETTAIHFKTITGRTSHFRKELKAKIYCIYIKLEGLSSCLSVMLLNKR